MCSKIIIFIATLCVVNASVITLNANNEDLQSPIEAESELRKCNNQECNQRCRRLKFPGGVCVNGRCKCDNFRTSEETVMETAVLTSDLPDYSNKLRCIPRICDRVCRFLRFDNGTCVNGRCKCAKKGKDPSPADDTFDIDAEDLEQKLDEIEDNAALYKIPRCSNRLCDRACRLLRFDNGTCVNGRCQCSGKAKEDAVDNVAVEIPQTVDAVQDPTDLHKIPRCSNRICNRACRLLRFESGTCVDGRCQCSGKDKETSLIDGTFYNDAEEAEQTFNAIEDQYKIPTCSNRICNSACRLLRFESGTCVDGRCKCSGKDKETSLINGTFDNDAEEAEQTFNAIEDQYKIPTCSNRICNRACRLLRFESGTCVDGRCKCSGKDKETSLTDGTFDNDAEEAEQTFNAIEDEYKIPTCRNRICNRACRLLRFESGTCVDGRCKCSGKAQETTLTDVTFDNNADQTGQAFDAEDDIDMDPAGTVKPLKCYPHICDRVCRLLRFDSGTCVADRCKCSKKGSATPERTFADEIEAAEEFNLESNI